MVKSPLCAEIRADQQDVVVGVDGRHDPRRGRAERGGSVDLLQPGILVGGTVGASPVVGRGARGVTVEVTAEDDGAAGRAT